MAECPPYVHRVNATIGLQTSDGYTYTPAVVEFATTSEQVITSVHPIHSRDQSLGISENAAIGKVITIRKQLKDTELKLNLINFQGGGGISVMS